MSVGDLWSVSLGFGVLVGISVMHMYVKYSVQTASVSEKLFLAYVME